MSDECEEDYEEDYEEVDDSDVLGFEVFEPDEYDLDAGELPF